MRSVLVDVSRATCDREEAAVAGWSFEPVAGSGGGVARRQADRVVLAVLDLVVAGEPASAGRIQAPLPRPLHVRSRRHVLFPPSRRSSRRTSTTSPTSLPIASRSARVT